MLSSLGTFVACAQAAGLLAVCPPDPQSPRYDTEVGTYAVEMQDAWAVARSDPAPSVDRREDGGPAQGADPAQVGAWGEPENWGVIGIHAAVLPTGWTLHYAYPMGGQGSRARLWNPATGERVNVNWSVDLFCSGLSHLADGMLYVTGGNDNDCDTQGRADTHLFNPFTRQWTALEEMVDGRWYPTNIELPDGRVVIFSGLARDCQLNAEVELFTPGQGLQMLDAHRYVELYPRMHLLTSGRIAHVGPESATYTFDLENGWQFVAASQGRERWQGTSVLIPGRTDEILIIGGGNPVQATCEIIDFSDPEPKYRYTGPVNQARAHADALILPDKTVLLVGGGRTSLYGDPVFVPELFDPETETWRELATHTFPRMYHATTVLLPDGRVLVTGQDNGPGDQTGEIYEPPYLHRGERPQIVSAPSWLRYDQLVTVEVDDSTDIDSVVLIKLTAVTHSVNFEQRLLDLPYEEIGDGRTLTARVLLDGYHAPPGHYMLFVVDTKGVPSVAKIVRVSADTRGDINGDGVIGFLDVLRVLAAWGVCGGEACPEDIDADGDIDLADLLIVLANWNA